MKARTLVRPDVHQRDVENLNGLAKFLEMKGHTLLIKGYAGAGKTTLALQLLKHFGNDSGVYVSTRVSKAKLRDEIPWSGDLFESDEFDDVRLGDAASMTKRVIDAITGRRVRAIVLDTWDAIAKELPNEKERLMAEKNLISLADNSQVRVIFVSEEPGKTTMDFLVDGIVELVRSEESGRIVRVVEFQKLRGTHIDQHKYLYTLQNGRFHHFGAYTDPDLALAHKFPVVRDPSPDMVSSGSRQLDAIFGGFKKAAAFCVGYEETVPISALRYLDMPLTINALNAGRSAMLIPFPGSSTAELEGIIERFVTKKAISERFRIVTTPLGSEEPDRLGIRTPILTEDIGASFDKFTKELDVMREKSIDGTVVRVYVMSTLENLNAAQIPELLQAFSGTIARAQHVEKDILLTFAQDDSPLRSRLISMSNRTARLLVRNRSIVMTMEKPASEAYVVEPSENPILPKVTQIV